MPWKELSAMDEKLRLVALSLRGDEPMSALCAAFGISRETGYKWRRRYLEGGPGALEERSRAPHRPGRLTPAALAAPLIALRRERPHWGPRKLLAVLARRHPEVTWPAASTVGDILRRAGLVVPRRLRQRAVAQEQPFQAVGEANDTWCVDFKGWFRTADGARCDPLTVTDAHSRYLLACEIMAEQTAPVRAALDACFRDHGLPRALRSDNGAPFAGPGAAGLSRLAVHWLKLGIRLERIVPGQPQQNGRHERMHRTLKAETAKPPAACAAAQQQRFDAFRHDFNHNRPHEALGQQTPAEHYRPSPRPMPGRVPEPCYDADHEVRRVRTSGEIRWQGGRVFISQALAGEPIGIVELDGGHWLARFAGVDLGIIDPDARKLHRFAAGRPPRCKASSTQPETVSDVSGL
jgi:transposase InsO family protein